MRKTPILFVVAALALPATAGAQGAASARRVVEVQAVQQQQPPPQPPPPPPPARPGRPAPRVYIDREQDGREEQRETFSKTVRIGRTGILDVQNLSGNIEIVRGGGDDATIEVTKIARARTQEEARALLPLVTVEINNRADRADIRTLYTQDEGHRRRNFSVSVNYMIRAPQGTRITARSLSGNLKATDIRGELALETASGNVQIVNAARVTKAKTLSGNVELTNIDSDAALDAGTMSGNVIVRQAKARRMELGTVSGSVIVQDVETERLNATSLSGNVEFSGKLAKGGRYELKSNSGNVKVTVAGDSGFEVDASSWSGAVHSDFNVGGSEEPTRGRRKVIRGVVGDGSAVVNITTFSGNVHLVKK